MSGVIDNANLQILLACMGVWFDNANLQKSSSLARGSECSFTPSFHSKRFDSKSLCVIFTIVCVPCGFKRIGTSLK